MANKSIFVANKSAVSRPNTVNLAGGQAFAMSSKEALAQYAVTSVFGDKFYSSAEEQVDTVLGLCQSINDPEFVAKTAVYARTVGKMKDTPVVLLAWLASNGHVEQVKKAFPSVCNNYKQVANFAQVIRSGRLGRKSFGSALKKLINNYLVNTDAEKVYTSSVGVGNPSIEDVIKMTHPKGDAKHNALFGYLLGKKYNKRYLPALIKQYEAFKDAEVNTALEVPNVPFQLLSNLKLNSEQWTAVARSMTWDTLRMNLNNLQNKGVFGSEEVVRELAEKLVDRDAIRTSKAFPYSIMNAFINTNGQVPVRISNALQDALEIATENVPSLDGKVAVLVDVSSSMMDPVLGKQGPNAHASKVSCLQVAALVGSTILRKNADAIVIPFDTQVKSMTLNPRDSVMTNAQKLAIRGGGTNVAVGFDYLNAIHAKVDAVVMISDNESWAGRNDPHTGWAQLKVRNPKAKLVMLDVNPNTTTPVMAGKDVLNIGGFSDQVFNVINRFVVGSNTNVIKTIDEVIL